MIKTILKVSFLIFIFFLALGISFLYSIKSGEVAVPDIKGKSLEEAEKILKEKNLEYILDISLSGYSEKVPQGFVLTQEPKGGYKIKGTGKVKIGVSLGPTKVLIPYLVGKYLYEAELYLKSQNFKIGKISYMDSCQEESIILGQSPQGNSLAPADVTIDLLVSKPKNLCSYVMPELVSKNYDFVLSELTKLNFKVEKPREIKIPHYDLGVILSQSPLPGTKISKKTPLIFTINSGL
ncbi:MAG: PASTA domain-containing protein [Thermoanaerobaculia bacterium]